LIDFGLSKVYGDDLQLTEGVGTVYTMAPEVLKGSYTQKADIWSVGVITYMLLSSQMPFFGRKRRHIVEQILNCQYDFRGRRWKRISQQAKNFIEDLLVFDQEDRVDATEALASTWLNKRLAATTRGPLQQEEAMARQAMLRYAGYSKLKKMALMVVAHKSTSQEIGILRKLFQKYDTSLDGSITFDQFCEALKESVHSTEDMKAMFDAVVSTLVNFVSLLQRRIRRLDYTVWGLLNHIYVGFRNYTTGFGRHWTNTLHRIFGRNYRGARSHK
jgi:calcium-dependent protein kinase